MNATMSEKHILPPHRHARATIARLVSSAVRRRRRLCRRRLFVRRQCVRHRRICLIRRHRPHLIRRGRRVLRRGAAGSTAGEGVPVSAVDSSLFAPQPAKSTEPNAITESVLSMFISFTAPCPCTH